MAVAAINVSVPSTSIATIRLIRREVYFFNLFRVLEAVIITGLMFSPLAVEWVQVGHSSLGRTVAVVYLLFSLFALTIGTRSQQHEREWVDAGLIVDIAAIALAMYSIRNQYNSLALLLLVNIGGGAFLLPRRWSFLFATLASAGIFAQAIASNLRDHGNREFLEVVICALAYFSVTGLCLFIGKRIRESDALAVRRGSDLLNLSQINELIIRRMKTGVLVVDESNTVHRWNESAWALIGNPSHAQRELAKLAPELSRRLYHWRSAQKIDNTSVSLAEGAPEVIPRFTRMSAHDLGNVLIFLDDTSLVSRRAEQLTLSTLGRLSASIAHEIRNPLAAISYSAQLLAESKLDASDQRMVEIIRNHTNRVNEIVENILHLARRERSAPESLDLANWATRFIEDYKSGNDITPNVVSLMLQVPAIEALADPAQLQQVVWNLVQNALRYGHLPSQPARVSVVVRRSSDRGQPVLEVIDRGPGIPAKVATQIFEPFFTTHEFGTGLGLYLARQMCEANQAALEYVPVAGGGSCFRVTLPTSPTTTTRVATPA